MHNPSEGRTHELVRHTVEPLTAAGNWSVGLLLLLAIMHFLLDGVATIVTPLWPAMEKRIYPAGGSILWLTVVWTMSTSLPQFAFGYWGDRFAGRWLIWGGPAVAVVCTGLLGLVSSPWTLALLLVVGGLAVASFHPEAATLAGNAAGHQRHRAMSVFAVGGYLGQAVGPSYAGVVTDRWGMSGLAWGILAGLLAVALLAVGLRAAHPPATQEEVRRPVSLAELLAGKRGIAALVLLIGTLRVTSVLGIPLTLSFLLKAGGSSNAHIGLVQSCFMAGIGAGGIACAALFGRGQERRVLAWLPLAAAPLILLIPRLPDQQLAIVAVTGTLLGVTLPMMISYGQQLFPQGQRVASSLTMGVSWGLGGSVAPAIIYFAKQSGQLETTFLCFAAASAVSSALVYWLPEVAKHPAE